MLSLAIDIRKSLLECRLPKSHSLFLQVIAYIFSVMLESWSFLDFLLERV